MNDLLGLKQQQAGIVQAYEAMKQGEETVRQGKAIMVFTVMTIVFVGDYSQVQTKSIRLTVEFPVATFVHDQRFRNEQRGRVRRLGWLIRPSA